VQINTKCLKTTTAVTMTMRIAIRIQLVKHDYQHSWTFNYILSDCSCGPRNVPWRRTLYRQIVELQRDCFWPTNTVEHGWTRFGRFRIRGQRLVRSNFQYLPIAAYLESTPIFMSAYLCDVDECAVHENLRLRERVRAWISSPEEVVWPGILSNTSGRLPQLSC